MPAKPKPIADPTVLSLINEKIDTLESNVIRTIRDGNEHLGGRIDALETTVKVQNGRIGRVETAHLQCQTERSTEKRLSPRGVALIGGGGMISGAVLLEVLRYVGEALHKAGLLG
jgi:hypothetical protein